MITTIALAIVFAYIILAFLPLILLALGWIISLPFIAVVWIYEKLTK